MGSEIRNLLLRDYSTLEIAILVAIFVVVSLWEYCHYYYKQGKLPYREGYNIFSLIQWVVIGFALTKIYGITLGLVILVVVAMFLQYVTHFTLGLLYNATFHDDPVPPLAFFVVMVWATAGLTAALYVVS